MAIDHWAIAVQRNFHTLYELPDRKVIYSNVTPGATFSRNFNSPHSGSGLITESAPIQRVRYAITPNEGSVEAEIVGGALGYTLDIAPRDVVTIFTQGYRAGEDTGLLYPRFRGYSTSVPNQHLEDGQPQTIHLAGLRDVLYRQTTGRNFVLSGELRLITNDIEEIIDRLREMGNQFGAEDILPDIQPGVGKLQYGIVLDKGSELDGGNVFISTAVNPGGRNLGTVLDAFAAVASTSSNKVVWDVSPYGVLFFRDAVTTSGSFTEGTGGAEAEWREVNAEEQVDGVRWFIAGGSAKRAQLNDTLSNSEVGLDTTTPDSLTLLHDVRLVPVRFGSSIQVLDKQVSAESGALYPATGIRSYNTSPTASWVGDAPDGTPTTARLRDHNSVSYTVFPFDAGTFYPFFRATLDLGVIDTRELAAVSFALQTDDSGAAPDYSAVAVGIEEVGVAMHLHPVHGKVLTDASFVQPQPSFVEGFPSGEHSIVFGDRARHARHNASASIRVHLLIQVGQQDDGARIAIAEFHAWLLDVTALSQMAQAERLAPERSASRVSLDGQQEPLGSISFTKLNGVTVSGMPVSQVETMIAGPSGLRTTYHIGAVADAGASRAGRISRDSDRDILLSSLSARRFRSS